MNTRLAASLLAVAVTCLVLIGCGGNSSPGNTPPDIPTETVQTFLIDFVENTVTIIETPVDSAAKVDTHPGSSLAEMEVALTVLTDEPGNPGRRHVDATVTNNGGGTIGANPDGTETGVDICFAGLEFRRSGGALLEGGGMSGYHSYNALTDMPVYRVPGSLGAGETSDAVQMSFQLPKNATTAEVSMVLRADTVLGNWATPSDSYITTVAGLPGASGYVNGPLASARFNSPWAVCVRDGEGDVLVADFLNNAIRRIADGMVSTLIYDPTLLQPIGVAEDAQGHIVVSAYNAHQVFIAYASGSGLTAIAGTGASGDVDGSGDTAQLKNPTRLAVRGDDIYVTDIGAQKLKRIRFQGGTASRFVAANYTVATVYTGTGSPDGVAADHEGNVFFGDQAHYQVRVLPRDSATAHVVAGTGASGAADGRGDLATFRAIVDVAVDEAGTVYVADNAGGLRRIRRIDTDLTQATSWRVETLVQHDVSPADGGDAGRVNGVGGVAVARDGTVWITNRHSVRRVDRIVH